MTSSASDIDNTDIDFVGILILVLRKWKVILIGAVLGLALGISILAMKAKIPDVLKLSVQLADDSHNRLNEMEYFSKLIGTEKSRDVLKENGIGIGESENEIPSNGRSLIIYASGLNSKGFLNIKANCILTSGIECGRALEKGIGAVIHARNSDYDRLVVPRISSLNGNQERLNAILFRFSKMASSQRQVDDHTLKIFEFLNQNPGRSTNPFYIIAEAIKDSPEKRALISQYRELNIQHSLLFNEIEKLKKEIWLSEADQIDPMTISNIEAQPMIKIFLKATDILLLAFMAVIGSCFTLGFVAAIHFWKVNFSRIKTGLKHYQ